MAYIGSRPADKALQTSDIEDSAITSAKIADGTIATADVADGAITSAKTTGVGGSNTPNFLVALNANQSIPNNTDTKVQFTREVFDSSSVYDNSTNYRFTVGSGNTGKYLLYAQVKYETLSDDALFVRIYKNGSQYAWSQLGVAGTYGDNTISVSLIDNATSATDYYEIYARHNNGSSRNISGDTTEQESFFYGCKIIE